MLDGAGVPPCVNLLGFDPTKLGSARSPLSRTSGTWQRAVPRRPGCSARPANASKGEKESEETLAPLALAALRRLPPDEQRERVAALRDAELTCAPGDRLDLLTGPGSSS